MCFSLFILKWLNHQFKRFSIAQYRFEQMQALFGFNNPYCYPDIPLVLLCYPWKYCELTVPNFSIVYPSIEEPNNFVWRDLTPENPTQTLGRNRHSVRQWPVFSVANHWRQVPCRHTRRSTILCPSAWSLTMNNQHKSILLTWWRPFLWKPGIHAYFLWWILVSQQLDEFHTNLQIYLLLTPSTPFLSSKLFTISDAR